MYALHNKFHRNIFIFQIRVIPPSRFIDQDDFLSFCKYFKNKSM